MSPFKNWDELREKLRSIKLLDGFGDSSQQENKEAVASLGRGKEGWTAPGDTVHGVTPE